MSQKYKIVLGVLGFVVFILVAYMGYGYLGNKYSADIYTPSQEGKTLAPDFTVYDDTGAEVKLSDFKGKPVVINFWASWCPPCREEMPYFQDVYSEQKDEVIFLMVNITDGQKETTQSANSYIATNNYTFSVYFDSKLNAAKAYNVSSIPSTYFVDKEGNIVDSKLGPMNKASLEGYIGKIK